ncbi:hypothetical protein Nmel_001369 [Mimus melanotis]
MEDFVFLSSLNFDPVKMRKCAPVPSPSPHSRLRVSQAGRRQVPPSLRFPRSRGRRAAAVGQPGPPCPPVPRLRARPSPGAGCFAGYAAGPPLASSQSAEFGSRPSPSWTLRPAPNPRAGEAGSPSPLSARR